MRIILSIRPRPHIGHNLHPRFISQLSKVLDGGACGDSGVAGDGVHFCNETVDAAATLLVSQRKTKRYLVFNNNMELVGWTNIDTKEVKSPFPEILALAGKEEKAFEEKGLSLLAFSGIHLMNPVLFPEFQSWPEAFSIIDFYLASCKKYKIFGKVMPKTKILDVGKLDTLSTAEAFLSEIE